MRTNQKLSLSENNADESIITRDDLQSLLHLTGALTEVSAPTMENELSFFSLRQYLIERITALLNQQPELLFSTLYRIDVAEDAVKKAFRNHAPGKLPTKLADLVIERQILKLHYRNKYSDRH